MAVCSENCTRHKCADSAECVFGMLNLKQRIQFEKGRVLCNLRAVRNATVFLLPGGAAQWKVRRTVYGWCCDRHCSCVPWRVLFGAVEAILFVFMDNTEWYSRGCYSIIRARSQDWFKPRNIIIQLYVHALGVCSNLQLKNTDLNLTCDSIDNQILFSNAICTSY